MATNFPTSVDTFTNPVSNDSLNSPSHSVQHADANDAIEAIEGYILNGTGAAYVSYTPTLAGTGWAIGDGTRTGAYSQIGKTVNFRVKITFGGTSTFGAASRPTITLPVTASSGGADADFITTIAFVDSSAGARYSGSCDFTTTTVDLFAWKADGTWVFAAPVVAASPFTWATGDSIIVAGTYEAA
jgi:hypothetical protein